MIIKQPVSDVGTDMEKCLAMSDARNLLRDRGKCIIIRLHEEDTIIRDDFGAIIKRIPGVSVDKYFYVFPIIYNPTVKQVEDAGLKEQTQVLIKTAVLDWQENGFDLITLEEIDLIRATVIINGAKYEIKDKQFDSQYQDTFLYVHLGLNRM